MAKDEGNKTGDSIFERIISIGDPDKTELPYSYGKGFRLDDDFFKKIFNIEPPTKEEKSAWDKHVELMQKAWEELKDDPRLKQGIACHINIATQDTDCPARSSGHGLYFGKLGAGNIPGYIRASVLKDLMGDSPTKFKHPNELLMEKIDASIQEVETEMNRINKQLAYQEGRRDGLFRAKMYLEEELKKKEGED